MCFILLCVYGAIHTSELDRSEIDLSVNGPYDVM